MFKGSSRSSLQVSLPPKEKCFADQTRKSPFSLHLKILLQYIIRDVSGGWNFLQAAFFYPFQNESYVFVNEAVGLKMKIINNVPPLRQFYS